MIVGAVVQRVYGLKLVEEGAFRYQLEGSTRCLCVLETGAVERCSWVVVCVEVRVFAGSACGGLLRGCGGR